jgi:hypothetical protein
MSDDKNRHTAHISEREKADAAEHLNAAVRAVYANIGPSPVLVEIREAMAVLGIQEQW